VATIHKSAKLTAPADKVWRVIEQHQRSEVHIFPSIAESVRQEGEYRVATMPGGTEIWERIVSCDAELMRASYIVPEVPGAELTHLSMQVFDDGDGSSTIVWLIDVLPHDAAEARAGLFDAAFADLVTALNAAGEE
jgi:hypothetical protein